MIPWPNEATAPSRYNDRSDRALEYMMDQMNIPTCGLQTIRDGINNPQQVKFILSEDGGTAGPWAFGPGVDMSYNNGVGDYHAATVAAPGVVAVGKYIPIHCGAETVHVAYMPKCGNILTAIRTKESTGQTIRIIDYDDVQYVDAPGTAVLFALGLAVIKLIKRRKT